MELSAVGAVSIQMNLANVQQQASISMIKRSMELQETQAASLLDGLKTAVPPSGHKLDMLI